MLITKFNALIRNRVVWGIFAVLVSFTMIGFFTDLGGCGNKAKQPGALGTLGGKPVDYKALQRAESHVFLRLRLGTGRDFQMTSELSALLRREAWKRLALLQFAEKEKLWASDEEVKSAIHRDPMFQAEGRFSIDRFEQFTQALEQSLGFRAEQFWDYLREELTLEKIRRTVSAGVWTAPYEVERLARNFADSYTVEYARAPAGSLTRDVAVTEAQIRAFYDTHPETFTVPDLVQAAYVAFPFDDYSNAVVTAEAVTNYYADHLTEYYTTNAAGEPEKKPIEAVEPEIRALLADDVQREKALEEASAFFDALYDTSGSNGFFQAAASRIGRKVRLTRFFAANEPLPELGVDAAFNSAAFSLSPEKNADFSEPILGSNAVYVLSYENRRPSRLPPYEEVKADAERLALAQARGKALAERGDKIAQQVRAAVKAGTPFDAAAKAAGLQDPVKTAGPFTAYTTPEPFETARLVSAIVSLQEGEISDLVADEDGNQFLIRCLKRTPGDPLALDPVRTQIRNGLNRRHAQVMVSQWEEDLLKKMGFAEMASPAEEEKTEPPAPTEEK